MRRLELLEELKAGTEYHAAGARYAPLAFDAKLLDNPVLLHFVGELLRCDAQASGGPRLNTSILLQRAPTHPTPSTLFLEAVSVLFVLTQVQTHLLFFAADPKADQRVNEFQ